MKIVHLVLLLSLAGASAACSGDAVTAPRDAVAKAPAFDGSASPDSTTNRDSGGVFGSGT